MSTAGASAGAAASGAARPRTPPVLGRLVPVPTFRDRPATQAADVSGVDLSGRPRRVPLLGTGRMALLLFLSSGCDGCQPMWSAAADPVAAGLVADETVVVVTHDPGRQDPAEVTALLGAKGGTPSGRPAEVVMSSAAWRSYRVQGPPFFALVDGASDEVATEGVAWAVEQVAADVRRARGAGV